MPDQAGSSGDITNPALGALGTRYSQNGIGFFQALIPALIGLLMTIGAIIFMFMLLWGAIQWMLAGGDKGAVEGAKGRISNALVGIILLFSSFAVVKLVEAFFGINILTIDIGPLVIQ